MLSTNLSILEYFEVTFWRLFFIFLHLAKYTSKKVLRHTISITRWYQHCLIFQRTKMWTIKIKKPRKESNGHHTLLSQHPYIFTDVHFALSSYNYAKYAKMDFLFVFCIKKFLQYKNSNLTSTKYITIINQSYALVFYIIYIEF